MASGQQIAEENVVKFAAWQASKTDDDFRNMAVRGVLSRTEIAAECGFAKSALTQNPRIKSALGLLEAGLREKGVLPPLANETRNGEAEAPDLRMRQPDPSRHAIDAHRLSRLEQDNASLKAEVAELKRQLSRFAVLQQVLAETGRLPR
jgi:hypothetical protein